MIKYTNKFIIKWKIIRHFLIFSSLLEKIPRFKVSIFVKYDLNFDLGYMNFTFELLNNIICFLNVSDNLLFNRNRNHENNLI